MNRYLFHFLILSVLFSIRAKGNSRNIKLVAINGNQYWFSSSSPYAPTLNFHLAYQYCRTLGLQMIILETKEEVDIISQYLNYIDGGQRGTSGSGNGNNQSGGNANNIGREYWTSGNRLGAESSWIWMSSGEQLNATFSEFWLNRQLSRGSAAKQCMSMKANALKRTTFTPEECTRSLPFICEQVRCVYYNYPVSPYPDPNLNGVRNEFNEKSYPAVSESSSSPGSTASESRASIQIVQNLQNNQQQSQTQQSQHNYSENLRAAHFISPNSLAFIAAQAPPQEIPPVRRKITLRPLNSQQAQEPFQNHHSNSNSNPNNNNNNNNNAGGGVFNYNNIISLTSPLIGENPATSSTSTSTSRSISFQHPIFRHAFKTPVPTTHMISLTSTVPFYQQQSSRKSEAFTLENSNFNLTQQTIDDGLISGHSGELPTTIIPNVEETEENNEHNSSDDDEEGADTEKQTTVTLTNIASGAAALQLIGGEVEEEAEELKESPSNIRITQIAAAPALVPPTPSSSSSRNRTLRARIRSYRNQNQEREKTTTATNTKTFHFQRSKSPINWPKARSKLFDH